MGDRLAGWPGIDMGYREFLSGRCLACLRLLQERKKTLRQTVSDSLVQEPILLRGEDQDRARDVLRPLQHTYCREALIDLVRLPRALAAPARWRTGFGNDGAREANYSILVPDGPIHTWGPNSRPAVPLGDEAVTELERPYCRIIVVAPGDALSPRAAFIWDRVRSALLEANIEIVQKARDDE